MTPKHHGVFAAVVGSGIFTYTGLDDQLIGIAGARTIASASASGSAVPAGTCNIGPCILNLTASQVDLVWDAVGGAMVNN